MILGKDNRKRWSSLDVLIMLAYKIYLREKCPNCGYPTWICNSEDSVLIARKKTVKCWVSREVDDWREGMKEGDDAKYIRPEVYSRDGRALWEFREPYYEELARQRAEEAEEDD